MRQKSMDEKPLTDSEVRMTTGLLYRAVCHGQAEAVIETYRAPMVPIRFHAGAVSLMNDMQMFTGLANCAKEIYATQSAHSLPESVWEELASMNPESPQDQPGVASTYARPP